MIIIEVFYLLFYHVLQFWGHALILRLEASLTRSTKRTTILHSTQLSQLNKGNQIRLFSYTICVEYTNMLYERCMKCNFFTHCISLLYNLIEIYYTGWVFNALFLLNAEKTKSCYYHVYIILIKKDIFGKCFCPENGDLGSDLYEVQFQWSSLV